MAKNLQSQPESSPKSTSLPQVLKNQLIIPPKSISPPTVSADLPTKSFLERSAESLSFTLASIEYSLSPSGALRSWVKFWILLCLYVSIPILLFTPLISYVMQEFSIITQDFYTGSQYLCHSMFYVGTIVLVVVVLLALLKSFLRS